jgi:hypothetical protein
MASRGRVEPHRPLPHRLDNGSKVPRYSIATQAPHRLDDGQHGAKFAKGL